MRILTAAVSCLTTAGTPLRTKEIVRHQTRCGYKIRTKQPMPSVHRALKKEADREGGPVKRSRLEGRVVWSLAGESADHETV